MPSDCGTSRTLVARSRKSEVRSVSLNYLATRFTCSWPWTTMVLLCDGRLTCGCADPYGRRVLGDTRTTSVTGVWTGEVASSLRRDIVAGGSKFCGDCPLKLPLKKDEAPPARAARRRHVAEPPVRRVHGGLQHLVQPGVLRAGNRHHAHASGRHARLRPVHASDRRGGSVAGARRLLQLRRGVPAQARRGDVRVHQDEVPAHLPLHEHQRPGAHRGEGAPARALGHRRGDLLHRRRLAGHLRAVPATRRLRQGAGQPAGDGRREGPARPRRAAPELALHPLQVERSRRRDGRRAPSAPSTSASIACAGRSPITRKTASRSASVPAPTTTRPSPDEIWDQNNLGNAIPGATPRAQIDVRDAGARAADPGPARQDRCGFRRASRTCRTGGSPRRPATAAGSCGWARSCARPTARSSTATTPAHGCPTISKAASRPTSQSRFPRPPSRAGTN